MKVKLREGENPRWTMCRAAGLECSRSSAMRLRLSLGFLERRSSGRSSRFW